MQKAIRREIDLTSGSLLKKLLVVALPLILTNILQVLFNVADVAVIGIFKGDDAVAGVGANTSLIHLITNVFIGLATGASVVLAKYIGQKDLERARKLVGTAILISVIIGVALIFVGLFFAETFLTWMNCDPEILNLAALYLRVYFIGMPIIMLYNFSAGILRAVGDTLRPMLYLVLGGVINVGLNVFFVTVCDMSVDGVAIATVVSQAVSALLATIAMIRSDGYSKLQFKHLRVYKAELKEIIKVGLPSGLQASMFSISNVIIQSTINTFLKVGTTANAIASQFDSFVAQAGSGVAMANMSIVSQNYGAQKINRIKKAILYAVGTVMCINVCMGLFMVLFADPLCRTMTQDPVVIELAKVRLNILCSTFVIGGVMDVLTFSLRSLGKSTTAMVISILFICVFRIIWINTFYLLNPTFAMIYYSYPISWLLSVIVDIIFLTITIKHLTKKFAINSNGELL